MNRRAFLRLGAFYLAACAFTGTSKAQAVRLAAQTLNLGFEIPTSIGMEPPDYVFPQPEPTATPTMMPEPTLTATIEPTLEPTLTVTMEPTIAATTQPPLVPAEIHKYYVPLVIQ
jgi:hypothetical protein